MLKELETPLGQVKEILQEMDFKESNHLAK